MTKLPLYFDSANSYRNGLSRDRIQKISSTTMTDEKLLLEPKNLFNYSFDYCKDKLWTVADRSKFYFYPIACEFPFKFYSRYDEFSGYSLITIPQEVIDDCINHKAGILLYDTWEGDTWFYYTKAILDICQFNPGLTIKHFIVVSGNLNHPEDAPFKHVPMMWFQGINQHNKNSYPLILEKIQSKTERDYKFILMNRRPDTGRFALIYKLWNFKENNLMSFDLWDEDLNQMVFDNASRIITDLDYDKMNHIISQLPLRLNDNVDPSSNPVTDHNIEKFLNSHLHLVTETFYGSYDGFKQMFFSEKTFKPIQMLQPFILLSYTDSLKYLKRHGYETFDSWIDESYDEEQELSKRIDAITKTTMEFISKSPKEIAQIHYDMLPVLQHNYYQRIKNVNKMNRTLAENLLDEFHRK